MAAGRKRQDVASALLHLLVPLGLTEIAGDNKKRQKVVQAVGDDRRQDVFRMVEQPAQIATDQTGQQRIQRCDEMQQSEKNIAPYPSQQGLQNAAEQQFFTDSGDERHEQQVVPATRDE